MSEVVFGGNGIGMMDGGGVIQFVMHVVVGVRKEFYSCAIQSDSIIGIISERPLI